MYIVPNSCDPHAVRGWCIVRAKRVAIQDDSLHDAAERFDVAIKQILTVDKSELDRREAEYQQQRATKVPRGPRPGRNYRRKTA